MKRRKKNGIPSNISVWRMQSAFVQIELCVEYRCACQTFKFNDTVDDVRVYKASLNLFFSGQAMRIENPVPERKTNTHSEYIRKPLSIRSLSLSSSVHSIQKRNILIFLQYFFWSNISIVIFIKNGHLNHYL